MRPPQRAETLKPLCLPWATCGLLKVVSHSGPCGQRILLLHRTPCAQHSPPTWGGSGPGLTSAAGEPLSCVSCSPLWPRDGSLHALTA